MSILQFVKSLNEKGYTVDVDYKELIQGEFFASIDINKGNFNHHVTVALSEEYSYSLMNLCLALSNEILVRALDKYNR